MFVTATSCLTFMQWPKKQTDKKFTFDNTSEIVSLSWSKDNSFMVCLHKGGRPSILNTKNLNNVKVIHTVTAIDNATSVAFQKTTKKCVGIGTNSGVIALYDTKMKSIGKLFHVSGPVVCLDFNFCDEYLGVAVKTGTVTVLDILGKESKTFNIEEMPTVFKFHPLQQDLFAVGTAEGTLLIYNLKNTEPIYTNKGHNDKINDLVFCSKLNYVITVGEDFVYCVQDLNKRTCIFQGHHQYPLTSLDINFEELHLVIGSSSGNVFIYEIKNLLTPICCMKSETENIRFIHFAKNQDELNKHISDGLLIEDKFALSKLLNEKTLKIIKDEIIADIKTDAQHLQYQMKINILQVQETLWKEFDKFGLPVDDSSDLFDLEYDVLED